MASYITTIAMMAGLTFVMSLWSVGIIRQSLQHQLLDIPNERSSHSQPTPRGGGLGFIVAFAIAVLITWVAFPSLILDISLEVWLMLIPLVGIGIWDDWRNLTAGVRYLIQLSVAAGVVYRCGIFPVPGLEELGGVGVWVAAGLTMIGLTALINFYNFMDGLDGLVAGVATVQLGFLALWCHQPGLWLWVAALIGFLYWNWAPAKIFMGDVGSTTLGAVVGISLLTQSPSSLGAAWTPLAILLPIVGDAVYTLFCRLYRGENIFKAHRNHLYQRLNQVGWPHAQVAGFYIALTIAIALGLAQFGAIAAWVSLGLTPGAIALAERYLAQASPVTVSKTPCLANED